MECGDCKSQETFAARNGCDYVAPPKVAYIHWDTGDLPLLLSLNLERTRRMLHDWTVVFFTTQEFYAMHAAATPLGFGALNPTEKSDYMRLWLMHNRGGLWLDISVVLNCSVTWMHDLSIRGEYDLVGFEGLHCKLHPTAPAIENYFLLCPPRTRLIALWLEEYVRAMSVGFPRYISALRRDGVELQKQGKPAGTYFVNFHALQQVLQRRLQKLPRMHLEIADNSMDKIALSCKWNASCMRLRLTSENIGALPYVKMSKRVRDAFPLSFFKDN